MKSFASIFTGFGLADIGAIAAGFLPLWGIEHDPDIAAVASQLPHTHGVNVASVCDIKWDSLPQPDHLHLSPPCQDYSQARAGGNRAPTNDNGALITACIRAIATLEPTSITIENVPAYQRSPHFERIVGALWDWGYWISAEIVDAADFGVPQNRHRLILRATRGEFVSPLPPPLPWAGWWDAVKDLELPPTTLTGWQQQAIAHQRPAIDVPFLIERSGARKKNGIPNNQIRIAHRPAFTIKAMSGRIRPDPWQCTAVINGTPHRMTPRAIARLQTVPDWYALPSDPRLAIKGLGNGVPCRMMEMLLRG